MIRQGSKGTKDAMQPIGRCRDCQHFEPQDLVRLDNHTRYRRNPAIYKAKVAVRRAVLRGTLTKPHRCRCGQTPVEAHHYRGYHKTHWLTVQWLCRSCHTLAHHTPTQ